VTETTSQSIVAGPLDLPADGSEPNRWRYLPALDGVRGLAVVAVVLFHFWPDIFPGGFVGVDVFFAMSGFLITGILMTEHRTSGRIDLAAFWGRRVRRLVPAVVVLVIVTAVATVATGTGSALQLADSVGALTWTTNLITAFSGGSRVFLHNSRTTIDHLWSLAIEEQFYLVWPPVALLVFRRIRGRRAQVAVALALVAASAGAMGAIGGEHAYFRTDTRAFELLGGAALALSGWAGRRRAPALTSSLALVGFSGLVLFVAFARSGDEWMYPWGFLLISASSLALVAAAVHPSRALTFVLESRPMRHLGQVSYGVYLWHIPVQRLLSSKRIGFDGAGLQIVRFAVLALVVEASFRFIEQPFRRRRLRLGWREVGLGYVAAAAAILLLVPATQRDVAAQWDAIDAPPKVAAGQQRVLVLGDLVGAVAASGLREDDSLAVWSLADPGCPSGSEPLLDGRRPLDVDDFCGHWPDRWRRGIERFRPDVVVLGGGYWDTLEQRDHPDGSTDAYFQRLVDRQLEVIAATRTDAVVEVVRMGDWSGLIDSSQRPLGQRTAATDAYDGVVDQLYVTHPGVRVLDVSGMGGWDDLRSLRSSSLR